MAHALYALGRVALAAIFLWSGYGKLVSPGGVSMMLAGEGLPYPLYLAYAAGVAEVVLGALVVVGWQARAAALGLVAFTIAATYIGHDFWTQTGAEARSNQIHAAKNLAIVGGLIMLVAGGAGRFSLSRK
jgi:putative oxidoreductase